jgi:hypothetical protein
MSSIPANELPVLSTATQQRIARLRAIASEFPEENARPLTAAELRLIASTPVEFLAKAALFADSTPNIGNALGAHVSASLRQAVTTDTENGGVVDEAHALIRRIEMANAHQKLEAVKAARALYRLAKSYITADVGDLAKTRVADMQRALKSKSNRRNAKVRVQRAKVARATPPEAAPVTAEPVDE